MTYETIALDDSLDLLDLLITEIASCAKNIGRKIRLRILKDQGHDRPLSLP